VRWLNQFLPDYDEFIARANAAYSGMAAKRMATADEIAQVIYGAATDGTNRLRCFCGEDTGDLAKGRRDFPLSPTAISHLLSAN
jgi:hypothetical protein